MVGVPSCPVTFEEFLALPGEGKREWVAGQVVEIDFSDLDHDQMRSFLAATLGNYLAEKGLGRLTGENPSSVFRILGGLPTSPCLGKPMKSV